MAALIRIAIVYFSIIGAVDVSDGIIWVWRFRVPFLGSGQEFDSSGTVLIAQKGHQASIALISGPAPMMLIMRLRL